MVARNTFKIITMNEQTKTKKENKETQAQIKFI